MAIEEIGLFPIEMAIYEKQKGGSIQAHEGDKGGRGLLLTLKDNGEPFDSSGIDLRLGFKDANGEEKLYDFEPVAPLLGKFKINYPEEMLVEQGGKVVNVEVKAYESLTGQVINFTPLYVYVNPEMVSDGQLIDSQEGSVLLKMLAEVQTVQDQLRNIDPVIVDNVVTVSGQIIPQEEARVLAENNRASNEVIRNQLYNQLLLLKIDLESIESELDTYPQREIERQENEVLREQLKAQLQSLQTDLNNAIQVALNAKGEKGEPFRHSDFTQEQLADLKGEKGDSFVYSDFSPVQLANLKGDKGDPFTYEDFTPVQLENLKGEKGDSGITVEDRAKLDNVPADTNASLSALTTDVNAQLADIENNLVEHKLDYAEQISNVSRLITRYVHSGNIEAHCSAVNIDTDTFTSISHGFNNGEQIIPVLNPNAGAVYPMNVFVGGMSTTRYYVINATTDTFQISTINNGSAVDLVTNATQDLTKWHFEKFASSVNITNFPPHKKYKFLIKGRQPNPAGYSNNLLVNGIGDDGAKAIKETGTTFGYGDNVFNANMFLNLEIIVDWTDILTFKITGYSVNSTALNSFSTSYINRLRAVPTRTNTDIISFSTGSWIVINGLVVEVYTI